MTTLFILFAIQFVITGIAGTVDIMQAPKHPDKPFLRKYWRTLVNVFFLCIQVGYIRFYQVITSAS